MTTHRAIEFKVGDIVQRKEKYYKDSWWARMKILYDITDDTMLTVKYASEMPRNCVMFEELGGEESNAPHKFEVVLNKNIDDML